MQHALRSNEPCVGFSSSCPCFPSAPSPKGGDGQQKWDERNAIAEIDRAIDEIRRAAIDDGKPLDDHPAVDAHEPRSGHLHRALSTLEKARADIGHAEDNGSVRGLRDRAIHHIDEAIRLTNDGIRAS